MVHARPERGFRGKRTAQVRDSAQTSVRGVLVFQEGSALGTLVQRHRMTSEMKGLTLSGWKVGSLWQRAKGAVKIATHGARGA